VVDRFTEHVVNAARQPTARGKDVRESCEFRISGDRSLLRLHLHDHRKHLRAALDGPRLPLLPLADEAPKEPHTSSLERPLRVAPVGSLTLRVEGHLRTLAQASVFPPTCAQIVSDLLAAGRASRADHR